MSNQSSIQITKPDLRSDPDAAIAYTIGEDGAEIESTCTAYGGVPDPTFKW